MTSSAWQTIKLLFWGLAAVPAVLAALFGFLSVQQDGKHRRTRARFRLGWRAVDESLFIELPEIMLRAVVKAEGSLNRWIDQSLVCVNEIGSKRRVQVTFLAAVCIACIVMALSLTSNSPLVLGVVVTLVSYLICLPLAMWAASQRHLDLPLVIGLAGIASLSTDLIVNEDLTTTIAVALSAMCAPLYVMLSYVIITSYSRLVPAPKASMKRPMDTQASFSVGVGVSVLLSLSAMLLGQVASPEQHVPKTVPMLLANLICDGATVVVTLRLIAWAVSVEEPCQRRIIAFVILDLLFAAAFAVAALYFGTIGSAGSLSLGEVLNVLVARSPDGSQWTIGPYFWVMHTTFIPTAIYMSLIAAAVLGKMFVLPGLSFLRVAKGHSDPHKLTATLCTLLAVIMGVGAAGAGHLANSAVKPTTRPPAPAVSSKALSPHETNTPIRPVRPAVMQEDSDNPIPEDE